ncbi:TLC domain containing 3Ba [Cynoglossus semilaevis]|uniref:TLC domain containing 3Ba n=1 Tax=Cynoglossus semilaevis TaxID=244447 RepID=UPI000D62F110|nr:protein FAM57B [Cynoglossus semilaevis]
MASSAGFIVTSSCSDVMKDRHWLTDSYVLFATPYFAYDIYAMYRCHRHKLRVKGHEEEEEAWPVVLLGFLRRERLLVLHHIFMVGVCCPASLLWRQGTGDYFQGVLFLAELSTPSVCLSKVLIQFNKQKSLLHKVNGLVLMVTFFCCRVLLFPYLYYSYSRYVSVSLLTVPLLVPWQCNLGAAVLWSLQLYWFSLILRGALRLLTTASLYVSVSLLTVPLLVPWQCNLGAAVLWSLQLYWFSLILRGALRLLTTASHASSHEYVSVSLLTVPLLVPWQCNLGAAVLWSLQLYWFSLILRGALRLLTTASHASSHE